jgi:hypothetical protein
MQQDRFSAISSFHRAQTERVRKALLEKRRKYNRLYMRSWRADPSHQASERENRQRWHYERKLRETLRAHHRCANDRGDALCGFCRKSPPITKVWRL